MLLSWETISLILRASGLESSKSSKENPLQLMFSIGMSSFSASSIIWCS